MTATRSPQPDGSSSELALADQIAQVLREQMLSGVLLPGTQLRDAALAVKHGASRNTVREAFRLLQSQGLTDHRRHRGTVVRRLDEADVRDVYVVRRALQLRAIEQVNHAPTTALDAVASAVSAAENARDEERWTDVGTASLWFHRALVSTLGSPTLDACMDSVLSRLRLAFAPMPDEGKFQAPWVARDRQINDLLQRGRTGDARDALRVYLDDSETAVLGAVREQLPRS